MEVQRTRTALLAFQKNGQSLVDAARGICQALRYGVLTANGTAPGQNVCAPCTDKRQKYRKKNGKTRRMSDMGDGDRCVVQASR